MLDILSSIEYLWKIVGTKFSTTSTTLAGKVGRMSDLIIIRGLHNGNSNS